MKHAPKVCLKKLAFTFELSVSKLHVLSGLQYIAGAHCSKANNYQMIQLE